MNTIEETTKTAGCPDWCDGDHVPFSKGNQVHHVSTVLHLPPKPDGSGFDLTHSLCQFQRAEDGFDKPEAYIEIGGSGFEATPEDARKIMDTLTSLIPGMESMARR